MFLQVTLFCAVSLSLCEMAEIKHRPSCFQKSHSSGEDELEGSEREDGDGELLFLLRFPSSSSLSCDSEESSLVIYSDKSGLCYVILRTLYVERRETVTAATKRYLRQKMLPLVKETKTHSAQSWLSE